MNKNDVVPKIRYLMQNHTGLIAIGVILTVLLSACGSIVASAASAQSTETVPGQVATDVAGTLTAQPTATSTATSTPTATPTATQLSGASASSCNNSEFLADMTIPDGTGLSPGETFVKTWRLRNIGSCSWSPNYSLVFVGGSSLGGANVQIGQTVAVNQNADVSVTLTAPSSAGTFVGFWRLADASGNAFGVTVDVQIVVGATGIGEEQQEGSGEEATEVREGREGVREEEEGEVRAGVGEEIEEGEAAAPAPTAVPPLAPTAVPTLIPPTPVPTTPVPTMMPGPTQMPDKH